MIKPLAWVSVFYFFCCPFSASASNRQEAIDKTLSQFELAYTESAPRQESAQQEPENIPADTQVVDNLDEGREQEKDTFYISGAFETNYIRYREFEGNNTLDRDYGAMDGFCVAIGYKSHIYINALTGKPFLEGYFRNFGDQITYDGRTWGGTPVKFNQRSYVRQIGLKIGAWREFAQKGEIYAYLDIARRDWYRGENEVINGATSYAEKYFWTIFGPGIKVTYKLTPRFSPGIEIEGLLADSPKMRADLLEGQTFKLGSVNGVEIKAPLKYYLFKNLAFDLSPYYTYWKINASEPGEISGVALYEPSSKTHIFGLQTGMTYSF